MVWSDGVLIQGAGITFSQAQAFLIIVYADFDE